MRPAALAIPALVVIAGCGAPTAAPTDPGGLPPSPDQRVSGPGLRALSWVIDDPDGYALARALSSRYTAPAAGSARARLAASGVRTIAVPRGEIAGLSAALASTPLGPDLWVGESSSWSPVLAGLPWDFTTPIRLHDGEMLAPPGSARLLVRAWIEPSSVPPDALSLRVDLAPQLLAATRERAPGDWLMQTAASVPAAERGQLLASLALETSIPPESVLLVFPESPELDWSLPPPPPPPPPATPSQSPSGGSGEGPGSPGAGPEPVTDPFGLPPPVDRPIVFESPSGVDPAPTSMIPTLGDVLLTDASPIVRSRRKVVLLLIPELPARAKGAPPNDR
ncbi:MAG: hypothetical protein HRU70_06300 [Phycisphaeraceae bacterium]|nr:MAG: hypothetical protein HRU70_06300 [Phycisphaeraceae bacterium]